MKQKVEDLLNKFNITEKKLLTAEIVLQLIAVIALFIPKLFLDFIARSTEEMMGVDRSFVWLFKDYSVTVEFGGKAVSPVLLVLFMLLMVMVLVVTAMSISRKSKMYQSKLYAIIPVVNFVLFLSICLWIKANMTYEIYGMLRIVAFHKPLFFIELILLALVAITEAIKRVCALPLEDAVADGDSTWNVVE